MTITGLDNIIYKLPITICLCTTVYPPNMVLSHIHFVDFVDFVSFI